MSISDYEISIIKGMLRMEFTPAKIQAYFTRPSRLVNPARIYDIRDGKYKNSGNVSAASDDEVGGFIDDFDRDHSSNDIYTPPEQDKDVFRFKLDRDGKISTLSGGSDLELADPQIREIYDELREKTISLNILGHNSLAGLSEDASKFLLALPENPEDASAVVVFMRGSGLRSKLASYEASRKNPDLYPVIDIDEAVHPIFEDLVQSFGLLVNLSPAMAALEQKASSPDIYKDQGEALSAVKPAIDDAGDVANADAATAIEEQVKSGLEASNDHNGYAQRAVAFSSVRNFTIAIFSPIYRAARYILGDSDLPSIVKTVRNTAAARAATDLYSYLADKFPIVVDYIRSNVDVFTAYAGKVISNPQLQDFVTMIIDIIKHSI